MSDKYVTVEDFENYKKHVETIMKSKKDPPKEVKPRQPSAYALFVKDKLPGVRAEHKDLSKTDLFKKVAGLWKDHKDQVSK